MPARNPLVFFVDLLLGPRDAGFCPSRGFPTDIDGTERDAAVESFDVAIERADGRVLASDILQAGVVAELARVQRPSLVESFVVFFPVRYPI